MYRFFGVFNFFYKFTFFGKIKKNVEIFILWLVQWNFQNFDTQFSIFFYKISQCFVENFAKISQYFCKDFATFFRNFFAFFFWKFRNVLWKMLQYFLENFAIFLDIMWVLNIPYIYLHFKSNNYSFKILYPPIGNVPFWAYR